MACYFALGIEAKSPDFSSGIGAESTTRFFQAGNAQTIFKLRI
jgi:hypothetical protein